MKRVALFAAYFTIWIINRWPAIRANTLFFDDFDVTRSPAAYYIGPYRPVLWLEYQFWHALAPDFLWTHGPKILGAFYTGLAAMALAELLHKWGVSSSLAALTPLIFVVNPVLADGGLWNTLHAVPLGIFFAIAAMQVRRWWTCLALALLAACTYQVLIAITALLAVAEPLIQRRLDARETGKRLAAIAIAAALQIAMMLVIRRVYEGADVRGLAFVPSISAFAHAKWHGATNLLANGWMPVIAFYTGALPAMSLWKWIPVVISFANAVAVSTGRRRSSQIAPHPNPLPIAMRLRWGEGTRRGLGLRSSWLATALATLVILALPAFPILVASTSPDAWRAAIPVAVALSVALVPALAAFPRRVAAAIVLAIVAFMAPVSWYESSERVASFRRDRAFVESLRARWSGDRFAAGFGSPIAEDRRNGGPRDLTWGFQIRTPGMWTMFAAEIFARPYLLNYHRLRWAAVRDCHCGPVTHLDAEKTSVVCGQSPPCSARRRDAPGPSPVTGTTVPP